MKKIFKKIRLRTYISTGVIVVFLPLVLLASYGIFGALGGANATPVAVWNFDEGVDNSCPGGTADACDSSGNNYHGSFGASTAAPVWQAEDQCVSGKCVRFNGGDDVITGSQDIITETSAFSISMWVKPNTLDPVNDVGFITYALNNNYAFTLYHYQGRIFWCNDTACSDEANSNLNVLPLNQWSHIAAVYDGSGTAKIYVNAKDQTNDATLSEENGTGGFYIGNLVESGNPTNNAFDGYIDEARVYNSALSAAQVKAEFAGGAAVIGASSTQNDFLTKGLAGYWKLDETSGNASDNSGNDTTLTNVSTTAYTSAKFGNGIEPDGSADYLYAADNTALSITGSLTLAAWIEPDDITGTENIIAKWDGANESYRLTKEGANIRMYIDADANYQATTGSPLAANTLAHIAGVYDSTKRTVQIYINGQEAASATTGTIPASIGDDGGRFHLGAEDSTTTAANFFDGHIDEARVYSRALSASEIKALYEWTPGPAGYWKFDEMTGTTAFDSSGGSRNATITDGGVVGRWDTGKYGGAYDMRGGDTTVDLMPLSSTLNLGTKNTITFWANFTSISSSGTVIGGSEWVTCSSNNCGYMAYFDDAGNLYSRPQTASGVSVSTGALTPNTWYHFAVTRDGTTVKFYMNGVQVGATQTLSASNAFILYSLTNFVQQVNDYPINGKLDEVRVYNYTRTQKQIVEDMNGGHPTGGSPIGTATSHWQFDECQGTTAYDKNTSSANNLTLSSASWNQSGKFNCSWNGDGVAYLSRADDGDFDVAAADSATISIWFKSDSASNPASAEYLFNKANATTAGYAVYLNTSGQVCFGIDDDTSWGPDVASCSNTDVYDNTWHHVAAVRNTTSDQLELYVDGKLVDSDTDTTTGSLENSLSLYLGDRDGTNNGDEFNGDLDEIKFFRSALDEAQVKILANASSSANFGVGQNEKNNIAGGAGNPPVSWLSMDENTGATVYDKSGNGKHGTIYDSRPFVPGKFGSAIYFDGTETTGRTSDSHITYADDAFDTLSSYTFSAWIKPEDAGDSWQNFFGVTVLAGPIAGKGFELAYDTTNNRIGIWSNGCSGGTDIDAYSPALAAGTETNWHHIVWTNNSSGNALYIDGIRQTLTYNSGSASIDCGLDDFAAGGDTTAYTLGCWYTNVSVYCYSNEMYQGLMDEVKIFDYALNATQVAYEYNRGAPTAWYKFDECTGTTLYNNAKNSYGAAAGNNATLTIGGSGDNSSAGTCTTSGAWYQGRTGKLNSSIDLDGNDDYVTLVASNTLIPTNTGWSVGMWFQRGTSSALGSDQRIINFARDASNSALIFFLRDLSTDQLSFTYADETNTTYNVDLTSMANVNTGWHHMLVTYDGTSYRSYLNGKLMTTTTDGFSGFGSGVAQIGKNAFGSTLYFDGMVDDLQIFTYPLSQSQVLNVFNGGAAYRWGPSEGS